MKLNLLSFIFKGGFTFLPFLLLSRLLSDVDYSQLAFHYTIFILVSSLAEFGFTFYSYRNASISFSFSAQSFLIKLKLIFCFLVVILISIYIIYVSKLQEEYFLYTYIFIFSGVLNSFGVHFSGIFRALLNFKVDCIFNALKLFLFFIILFFLHETESLNFFTLSFGYFVSNFISFYYIYRQFVRLKPVSMTSTDFKKYFFECKKDLTIYGFQTILVICYLQLDAQLIAFYLGEGELSKYLDITRLVVGGCMAIEVIVMKDMPIYLKKFTDKVLDVKLSKPSIFISFLFFASTCILSVLTYFDINFFELIYGNRGSNVKPFMLFYILLIVYIRTLSIIPSTLLSASDRKVVRLKIMLFVSFISVILNSILIPVFKIDAAYFVLLLVNFVLFLSYFFYMRVIFNFISITKFDFFVIFFITVNLIVYEGNF